MLRELKVDGCATYTGGEQCLGPLKEANFIFGTNGSGKTTISRIIAAPGDYPSCHPSWTANRAIEALVLNSDFSKNNYGSEMQGIFTLGDKSIELNAQINDLRDKSQKLRDEIAVLRNTLGVEEEMSGKLGELKSHGKEVEEFCWEIKNKHDSYFQEAFTGLRNSKKQFAERVMLEAGSNAEELKPLDDLKNKAESLFRKIFIMPSIQDPEIGDILQLEDLPILSRRIVGKEDVEIAGLIRHLQNSDWVRHGLNLIGQADGKCPFCQQKLPDALEADLRSYFDETYVNDVRSIELIHNGYQEKSSRVIRIYHSVLQEEHEHLDKAELAARVDRLDKLFAQNLELLAKKRSEPSIAIELHSVRDTAEAVRELRRNANVKIGAHNELISNQAQEQMNLKTQIWKFIVEDSRKDIDKLNGKGGGLQKAIASLSTQIKDKEAAEIGVRSQLRELEKSITSVEPAVNAINNTLASFGFISFKLATAGEKGSKYRILRRDGSDAAPTLSEGRNPSSCSFIFTTAFADR